MEFFNYLETIIINIKIDLEQQNYFNYMEDILKMVV